MKRFKKMQILLACGVTATAISGISAPVFADEIAVEKDAQTSVEGVEKKAVEVNSTEEVDNFSDQMTDNLTQDTDLVLEHDSVSLSTDAEGIDGQDTSEDYVQNYEEKTERKFYDFKQSSDLSYNSTLDSCSDNSLETNGSVISELSDTDDKINVTIDKKEAEFGEEIVIKVNYDDVKGIYNDELSEHLYFGISKDGDVMGFSHPAGELFVRTSEKTLNGNKAKMIIKLSEGSYKITGYSIGGYFHNSEKGSITVKPLKEEIVFDNIKYDKKNVTVGDVIKIIMELPEPYFSKKIDHGCIIVVPKQGGSGQLIYVDKESNGKLVAHQVIDNYWKNGIYAARAFYGYYFDEQGYAHFTYYEKKFNTGINFQVNGSPEEKDERGGGPRTALSPSVTSPWDDNSSTNRTAKVVKRSACVAKERTSVSIKKAKRLSNTPETGDESKSWQLFTIFTAAGVMDITVISSFLNKMKNNKDEK